MSRTENSRVLTRVWQFGSPERGVKLARATCRVTCHVVRRVGSAIKFDRLEIAFISALFDWLNH